MYDRRDVLRGGAVFAGVGAVTAVAGCLDDLTGDDGADEYDAAVALLEENDELFEAFSDAPETPSSFDERAVDRNTDEAEAHLDAAEDAGYDADLIENARAVITFQRELAGYNVLTVEFDQCLDTVGSYAGTERFDDAQQRFGQCRATFGDMEDTLSDVRNAHGEIDPGLLDDDLVHEDIGEDINIEAEALSVLDSFLDGLGEFIDGMVTLESAFEDFEGEQLGAAEYGFRQASGEFADSESTMASIEADPDLPADFEPDVIEFRCFADAMADASNHFADATAAADRGDWDSFDAHMDDGEAALDRCE